ncbi:SMC-Scp complex subunit ScpB [Marinimicrobium sp. C2-29]|uniref:SMC-Scp complex subunit ScpB n=1 Tax=Marinimicrobium sp. C2-29 TaxID=3139825 RepID=UPI003139F345
MTIEQTQLRNIIEGALLAAGQPLNLNKLKSLFEEDEAPEKDDLLTALNAIAADCEGRGFELKEVGSGWRFQVRTDFAPWINRLWEEKPQKYSRAVLETLALVAYRQPITRGDIEEIRGVAVSSHIIKSLTEREWVKVVGHRDVPGRPALYATTRHFLDYFNLKSLEELPSLGEIRDLNEINKALDLNDDVGGRDPEADQDSSESSDAEGTGSDSEAAEGADSDHSEMGSPEGDNPEHDSPEHGSPDNENTEPESDDESPQTDAFSDLQDDAQEHSPEPEVDDDRNPGLHDTESDKTHL